MTTDNINKAPPDVTIEEDQENKPGEPEVLDPKKELTDTNSSEDSTDTNMDKANDEKREGVEQNFTIESSEVANGFKFLILSLNAYAAKQFEEAGALLAQAAECGDVTHLTNALMEPISGHFPQSQEPITTENLQQLAGEGEGEGEEDEGEGEEDWEAEDEESDDEMESESSESTGIIHRRKVTSLNQIGKILAASMEATASEEDPEAGAETEEESEPESEEGADADADEEAGDTEEDDSATDDTSEEEPTEEGEDDDVAPEPDPDVPGASLIPVSFSSAIKVKMEVGSDVKSPIRLKN